MLTARPSLQDPPKWLQRFLPDFLFEMVGHAGIDHSFMSMRLHCSAAKGRHPYLGRGLTWGAKTGMYVGGPMSREPLLVHLVFLRPVLWEKHLDQQRSPSPM